MKSYILSAIIFFTLFSSCKKEKDVTLNGNAIVVTPKDFLSTSYDKLIIQVQYVNGMQPTQSSVDNLKNFLTQHINKTSGVEVVYSSIPTPGKAIYNINDIQTIENGNRSVSHAGKTITAYILFIDGDYAGNNGNQKTLGVAYGSSSMVIFENTIRGLSGGLGQPSVASVETSVSEHEFGHILGLVNNGTAMASAHQDEPHGKHCNNSNCLMYYQTETNDLINNLIGNNIPALDANCVSDLQANGGK